MAESNRKYSTEAVAAEFTKQGGNISETARILGVERSTVRRAVTKVGLNNKPFVGGDKTGTVEKRAILPAKGLVKRYLLTSAQNNTRVNKSFWEALQVLAEHYEAEVLVGTYSYNQNAYGTLAVKRGTHKGYERSLWFDPLLEPFISDERIELADGLVWCGEMNILPTAEDPLSGLETYSHRKSAIFPHAKVAMRSIATMQGEGTKLNYTTGTVTMKNYIQKKAGLKAEHHHRYAAIVVEVDHTGYWSVRQLGWSSKSDVLQDLDVVVKDGAVTTGNAVEAITWGDLHATVADPQAVELSQDMLEVLRPKTQFLHDVLEGVVINHHTTKDPHARFKNFMRGLSTLANEVEHTIKTIAQYERQWCRTVVVDSNHDSPWILRWLREYDYRLDPANAVLFLQAQLATYQAIEVGDNNFHILEYLLMKFGCSADLKFLRTDESYKICGRKIECGMHGHLGPNGAKGTPASLNKIGRRANTAHTHSAGIWNGLYVAGTSTRLRWDYAKGPSSWSQSHVVTYANGMRSIVTMWNGRWRA